MSDELYLQEIDPDNWREDISVSDAQRHYVSDLYKILARAYAYRDFRSRAYLIYRRETCIGAGLYYDLDDLDAYDFSQFFIDQRYQGQGYGKQACKMFLDRIRRDGKYQRVVLCYIDEDIAAKRLYEGFGFVETGERDGDEIIMSLDF